MKERKLVIGYGNRLRADDGVGWEVASRLAAAVPSEAAHILTVHQLTPELAESVSEADLVIFIDASAVGKPGTWRCDQTMPESACGNSLGHHLDVNGLLAYARAVYNASPEALVVSVAAESFDLQDHLSASAEAALPGLIDYIRKIVCGAGSNPNDLATLGDVVSKEISVAA
jgi:hydrogenase maturation protease